MAIRYAFAAWEDVTPGLIQKCFKKSGFKVPVDEESMDDDDDVPLAQLISDIEDNIPLARLREKTRNTVSVNDILDVDSTLPAREERTDDDIVSSVSKSASNDVEIESEDDEDTSQDACIPLVTKQDANGGN